MLFFTAVIALILMIWGHWSSKTKSIWQKSEPEEIKPVERPVFLYGRRSSAYRWSSRPGRTIQKRWEDRKVAMNERRKSFVDKKTVWWFWKDRLVFQITEKSAEFKGEQEKIFSKERQKRVQRHDKVVYCSRCMGLQPVIEDNIWKFRESILPVGGQRVRTAINRLVRSFFVISVYLLFCPQCKNKK